MHLVSPCLKGGVVLHFSSQNKFIQIFHCQIFTPKCFFLVSANFTILGSAENVNNVRLYFREFIQS